MHNSFQNKEGVAQYVAKTVSVWRSLQCLRNVSEVSAQRIYHKIKLIDNDEH